MGILNNIAMSFSDSTTIATTPREVIFHSCPSATTDYDFFIVLTICITILLTLIVIALIVGYSVSKKYNLKSDELKDRNSHELSKLEKEYCLKKKKDIYDSAWRTINHAWEESKDSKKEQQESNVDDAWKIIKNLWESEIPANNNSNEKSGQPES